MLLASLEHVRQLLGNAIRVSMLFYEPVGRDECGFPQSREGLNPSLTLERDNFIRFYLFGYLVENELGKYFISLPQCM